MNLSIVCGMPQEFAAISAAFSNVNIVQFQHSNTFNLSDHIPKECSTIISMGLAGGLDTRLDIADIAIATSITDGSKIRNLAVPDWINDLKQLGSQWFLNFRECPWYSSGKLDQANSVIQRKLLLDQTKAWAIDDESFFVNQVAIERNIQLLIIRSISDTALMNLPPGATGPIMNPDGSANTEYLYNSVKDDPSQIGELIEVGIDFAKSLSTLKYVAVAINDVLL